MIINDEGRHYESAEDWRKRLARITPGGAQTMSKRPAAFGTAAFPGALVRGDKGHVWDTDGHEYIDLIAGLAAVGIGHAMPQINGAVHRQLEHGVSFSLPTMLECEVAELLYEVIPCADMVRFVKTGSEACQAAVRIARRHTGRSVVLVCGYHGWHDWYAASKPTALGVPEVLKELVIPFAYNDLASLEHAYAKGEEAHDGVAAVIMEPTLFEEPKPGYLEAVRNFCRERGLVLIFDEMVTGFRWAVGGYQDVCGVMPDLATFGKAMANGYPLAAVVGSRNLMEGGDIISGTFGGEAVGLAACQATIEYYLEQGAIDGMQYAAKQLWREFQFAIDGADLPARLDGQIWHPRLIFTTEEAEINGKALAYFVQEMAAHGVLIHPAGWNIMEQHSNEDDIFTIRNAAEMAAHAVKMAMDSETLDQVLIGMAATKGVRGS